MLDSRRKRAALELQFCRGGPANASDAEKKETRVSETATVPHESLSVAAPNVYNPLRGKKALVIK